MENTQRPPIVQLISGRDVEVDQDLPTWARRSNPIVKRELGTDWKRLFPDMQMLGRAVLLQAVLVMILPVGGLTALVLPLAIISIFGLPVALGLYVAVLFTVINVSATAMVATYTHHTLDLLRVSPLPLERILLGKIAASLWRRMDDLDLALLGGVVCGLPVLAMYHLAPLRADDVTWAVRGVIAFGTLAIPPRMLLEPLMLGALAVGIGATNTTRAVTVTTVLAFGIFYYVILLVPLFMGVNLSTAFLLTVILPLLVPMGVTFVSVWFAAWYIKRL